MANLVGVEPTPQGFGDQRAAAAQELVGALGIAPRFSAYEADVGLLHYAPEPHAGIEPAIDVWKTPVLPLHQ